MNTILFVITGLVLFLYALNALSQGLKGLSGDQLKMFHNRFTNNVLKGIISGSIVTILLNSSSVVIIMTIALVKAGALSFKQAMGVVMGLTSALHFPRRFCPQHQRVCRLSDR